MVRADRVDGAAPEGRRSSARAASSSRTSIWAVLYHAGINDKFSISSAATADAPPGRDDNYGRSIPC